ncbi:MAG: hypothetical protein ACYS9X_17560 [Planctomycetota bacterium]|jgi:hypothetical protein
MLCPTANRIHILRGIRNAVRNDALAPFAALVLGAAAAEAMTAADAVRGSGARGGLVVHVGCGPGEMTAKLRLGDD